MKNHRIELEDQGQDLLFLITDDKGLIVDAGPFHAELYKGGYIPIQSQEIGRLCMIHHPPSFNFGYLKYRVESIKEIND